MPLWVLWAPESAPEALFPPLFEKADLRFWFPFYGDTFFHWGS